MIEELKNVFGRLAEDRKKVETFIGKCVYHVEIENICEGIEQGMNGIVALVAEIEGVEEGDKLLVSHGFDKLPSDLAES